MDEYLQCLYDYILEERRDKNLVRTEKYHKQRVAMKVSMDLMERTLDEEQQKSINRYLEIESRLFTMEMDWLFEEAVALGKWLGRS